MPKKRFGEKHRERERTRHNPVFWLIAFLFTVTAGLALLDFGKTFSSSGNGLTGAMAGIEKELGNEKLVKCSSASDCPSDAICVQGYCAVDVSGDSEETASGAATSKPSNAITGAVAKAQSLFTKKQLVECQSNFDCPKNALCKEGYCFKPVPEITGMAGRTGTAGTAASAQNDAKQNIGSPGIPAPPPSPPVGTCDGYCGGKSAGNCYCDSACEKYGDCCPDYKEFCKKPECTKDEECIAICVLPCKAKCVDGQCVVEVEKTCKGYCGKQAPAGCYCDSICENYDDCCPDYNEACGSGKEYCGTGSANTGCYCDEGEKKICGEAGNQSTCACEKKKGPEKPGVKVEGQIASDFYVNMVFSDDAGLESCRFTVSAAGKETYSEQINCSGYKSIPIVRKITVGTAASNSTCHYSDACTVTAKASDIDGNVEAKEITVSIYSPVLVK